MHTSSFAMEKNLSLFAVAAFALLASGCGTVGRGAESTVLGIQKVSSFENKKVTLSFPVVVEKDMETKKTPDTTEKVVADEVYTDLKKNLVHKGIFSAERDGNALDSELRVHYVNRTLAEWEYFGSRAIAGRKAGGQIVAVRVILKRAGGLAVAYIDAIDNTGTMRDRQPITQAISAELATQIEKILKEGVVVGKSSPAQ